MNHSRLSNRSVFGVLRLGLLIFVCGIAITLSAQGAPLQEKRVFTNDDVESAPSASANSSPQEAPASPEQRGQHGPVGKVAPFVATPMDVVDRILKLANVGPSDTVYDLGSGDGRVVIMAAEKYGAKAVGVELDKELARESAADIERLGLARLAKVIQGDLFDTDVSPASVVVIYLLQAANRRLSPILEKDLKAGTRVVAHDIRIPDWKPVDEISLESDGVQHFIYLYRVPDSFRK